VGPTSGPDRSDGRRAFTLLELMVVILVVGVLSAILTPVLLKAREASKNRWAQKELNELGAVISIYHRDHSGYPPDTGDWGATGGNNESPANIDERSIHRYLGSKVTDWKGEEYDPYMHMDWERVAGADADPDGVGEFLDPFEFPYELDAMHMIPPDPSKPASSYKQCGWPYRLQTQDKPTLQERQAMVLDYKFVSYGPDTFAADFPFDPDPTSPADARKSKDDISSWR
jgi:prepilin-type N-terminal cleavage/methylation domain-containing protein